MDSYDILIILQLYNRFRIEGNNILRNIVVIVTQQKPRLTICGRELMAL